MHSFARISWKLDLNSQCDISQSNLQKTVSTTFLRLTPLNDVVVDTTTAAEAPTAATEAVAMVRDFRSREPDDDEDDGSELDEVEYDEDEDDDDDDDID